ncbi:MAG: L-threonylcarbamoyladenylate synthase [Planctomycetota bacterium]|nr:L-threonylcarbamoyladenylate synthase [Planctomycetota bacterium]
MSGKKGRTSKTKVFKINRKSPNEEAIREAADLIREGGIVAIPTETVYGLAVNRAIPEAVERLNIVKERSAEKHYTVHIASSDAVWLYVNTMPPLARHFERKFWPGPLTLVLDTPDGSTVGLRFPKDNIACAIIERAKVPVIAPSANPSELAPATDAQEVLKYFDGKIDAVVDGGKSPLRTASTVVQITGLRKMKILRKGALPESELDPSEITIILFVCTGNLCRSPMAEALLRMRLSEALGINIKELESEGFYILSAGTAATEGMRASENAFQTMLEYGYDLSAHRSRHLSPQMLEDADLIIVMGDYHRKHIESVNPALLSKVELLHPQGIEDPIGQPIEVYRNVAAKINDSLKTIVEKILESRTTKPTKIKTN